MRRSDLVNKILENAEQIRKDYDCKHLSATIIVAAFSGFCCLKYNGIEEYYYFAERYEEERLRYVYKKIFLIGGNLQSLYARKVAKKPDELDCSFDFTECEKITELRGRHMIPADILLLSALSQIPCEDRVCSNDYRVDFDFCEILEDIDVNIYDYVIAQTEKIKEQLQKKINEAVALRDWRPAKKFAEPEELSKRFFDAIKVETIGNVLHIDIPFFFGCDDLQLSVYKVGDTLYLHDNGCAINHLKKQVRDGQKLQRILNKVCNSQWIIDGRVMGIGGYDFWYYLQRLIFIAHADLFYTRTTQQFYYKHKGLEFHDESQAEEFDVDEYLGKLKKELGFGYDENKGLYMAVSMTYSRYNTTVSYLMETLDNGQIRLSDRRKGKYEGEIFEAFYWDHNDITLYKKFIEKIANRFGGFLEDKNIYLIGDSENWLQEMFKFINLAVLLSEVGCDIRLPQLK